LAGRVGAASTKSGRPCTAGGTVLGERDGCDARSHEVSELFEEVRRHVEDVALRHEALLFRMEVEHPMALPP